MGLPIALDRNSSMSPENYEAWKNLPASNSSCRLSRTGRSNTKLLWRLIDPGWSMTTRKLQRIGVAAIVSIAMAYPAFVLLFTWAHVAVSNLPGGRHGPLDAYRHTLASAVVAYTLGAPVVEVVTGIMERGSKDSNRMDRHNNRIGAAIGARAGNFSDIEPAVADQIASGMVNATKSNQITWLPESRWRKGMAW
ncbi:MAG TPA: hypothetical protein PKE17_19760 [Saprospiraceae bacterium]|nr:hypothetical protein [Saprospiraceae bacterium]